MIREAGFQIVDASEAEHPLAVVKDADAILALWQTFDEKTLTQLTHCKLILRVGIGVDTIDIAAARRLGIRVSNVPDYCIDEVADHAFALALALSRQLPALDRGIRSGQWRPAYWQPIHSYATRTFATLGLGRIAQGVLARAKASRFQLAAYDPYQPDAVFTALGVRRLDLADVFRQADLLSLHVPLTAETRHIVDAGRLAQMKADAILVNTSRGPLVDTVALADALLKRQICAAGLDVFEEEPLPADHPLLACENAILTPHQAWYSEESGEKLYIMAAEEIIRALRGEPLRNCVNC
jgi:D-3-phosphoglycerate dehydrogenase